MRFGWLLLGVAAVAQAATPFWMEKIAHTGKAAFNTDATYKVFRNVKDYGAKGDGITDDTAAIQNAISSGNRCGPDTCMATTVTPAIVYFPAGTYIVSRSIVDYYYTQLIGDPNNMPVIKGASNFDLSASFGLVDGNQYGANGLKWLAVNVFFRQIRNIVFDTTAISGTAYGLHWPTGQATTVHNCVFKLGAGHTGLFIESGSGGMMSDLVFQGGAFGAQLGNQQYTMRNLTFRNADTAIKQIWDWGWTYKSINIVDCNTGIDMSGQDGSTGKLTAASVTLLDSSFSNVSVGIKTARKVGTSQPAASGTLILQNVVFNKVPIIVRGPSGTVLAGSRTSSVAQRGYIMGNIYDPTGPKTLQTAATTYFPQPAALLQGGKYLERSKPQYESYPLANFKTARAYGAKGDGKTDDTAALNKLLKDVSANFAKGWVAFIDAGTYKVSDTVFIPKNCRVVGETISAVIMASGTKFADISKPYPVVKVGNAGDVGTVEWSDTIVSTQGAMKGAVLIEYNVATSGSVPSGLWDVHTRIGGFKGSNLLLANCPTTPTRANYVNQNCIAAYMSMHIKKTASNLYMENNWFWVADHDIEDQAQTQITVFAGRGLLIESTAGKIWLVGTSVEHHTLYQYQLVNTQDIFAGQIQTETPYYQPNPPANLPFPVDTTRSDPDFVATCKGVSAGLPGSPACALAWGLRVLGSRNVVVYGAGLYSFFNNYSTACSAEGAGATCQARMASVTASSARSSAAVLVYGLNTVGTVSMFTRDGKSAALYKDNDSGFTDSIALFKY